VAGGTSGTGDTRNGSLGADFLGRFNLIIDYPGRKIHIMANRSFEEEFHYGMSGIEIWVPVPDEHRYIIARIRQPSRAAMAGIRSGDEILSINGTPCGQLSLDDVYRRLLGKDGKKISMELLRKGHRITVHFHLENYI
jgi:C-terminal processing protease CtpA/Prc